MWRNADVLDFVAGCVRTTTRGRRSAPGGVLRARPVQPARVDRGGRVGIWTRSIRRPRGRRARVTRCFDHFGEDPRRTATRRLRDRRVVRGRGRRPAHRAAQRGRRVPRRERRSGAIDMLLRRAERAAGAERRESITARCSAAGSSLEPARPAHGRNARCARGASGPDGGPSEDRGLGAQLAPRRRARDRDGRAASSTSASSCASATAARQLSSASRRTPGPSPPPRTGDAGRTEARSPGASREAGRSCSTVWRSRAVLLDPDANCEGRRLERAIGVMYRPETERSPTISTPGSRQFDAVLTSTRRARSSRSSGRASGRRETYPWAM